MIAMSTLYIDMKKNPFSVIISIIRVFTPPYHSDAYYFDTVFTFC